ncbi:hypothetical protein [Demequina lutea]|uniref:CHASE2 domain-containing sensor protein n=1 Tax=Demequina lutea TaxID=431489 RepID=A0A7Z0CJI5_9MICO|nr:hypothetical protein [Demequina lutea]NYI40817.1 CHASE2 domain-containing sensor protein [Demequina lutea]
MHPVAVKCIRWAVGLFVLGALTSTYGSDVYYRLSEYAGINASAGLTVISVVVTLMQWTLMPLGASLVGAAVVIQTLAPHLREVEDGEGEDSGGTVGEGEDSGGTVGELEGSEHI